MRVVTVARKPIPGGSVTANVLQHGCGALNIDGCRIGYENPGDQARAKPGGRATSFPGALAGKTQRPGENRKGEFQADNTKGRWPANLILQHQPGCRQTGTTTAPGYTINRWTDGAKPFGGGAGHEYESEQQPDESVAVWECAEGCAVKGLGDQSGESKGTVRKPTGKAIYPTWDTAMVWNSNSVADTTVRGIADTVTAARYFKQVQETNKNENELPQELLDYLETLITPPAACEPALIVTADLNDVDWDAYGDQAVHGVLTVGNPEKHLQELDRVLKPGAHLLVISDEEDLTGATAACAIEDFGYQIRDTIAVLDTPREFYYIPKASRSERNAGVPEFEAEVTFERCFPLEGVDQDDLWEQIVEVVDENYLENWLLEGIPAEELPDHLLKLFEERVLVDVQTFRNNHPTLKPVALMGALMGDIPKGSIVVDPFMGSGSTGIAALNQKMNFVGIEQDASYLKIAHHRIHHTDRSNAAWDAADIQSDVVEEKPATKSLTDFFGF